MSKVEQARRIREAHRIGLRNRLVDGDGLLPEQADRWLNAWAEQAGEPEAAAEFDAAYEWIVSELAAGRRL